MDALHESDARVANIPARLLGYGEEWRSSETRTPWAEGEMRQAAVFGEHLRLRRRVEVDLDGNAIRLTDTRHQPWVRFNPAHAAVSHQSGLATGGRRLATRGANRPHPVVN